MRFDDMLATLLAQPMRGEEGRVMLWRQLVDLLAQGRFADGSQVGDRALDCIVQLRSQIPAEIKAETARALAGQSLSIGAVALFAEEPGPIVAPIIAAAQLRRDEWLALLPRLTPTARALLRHRRDLDRDVVRALDSFGHSDFVIPASEVPVGAPAEFGLSDTVATPAVEMPSIFEAVAVPEIEAVRVSPALRMAASTDGPDKVATRAPNFVASSEISEGETQIRELMARIEAYQSDDFVRPDTGVPDSIDAEPDSPPAFQSPEDVGFQFETGADGTISWVLGVPRGPVIGETIAVAAVGSDHGVDGHVAGAFRQRAPFRDARLTIGGDSAPSGEWRISAVPMFDAVDGRFNGYRGTGRRPRVDEIASPSTNGNLGIFGAADTSDSLRQLVHELRTPLNAIIGFSEMIEGQFLGPASMIYRERASDITAQGRRLLTALEDLDLSATLDSKRVEREEIDPAALLERLHGEYQGVAAKRGYRLKFRVETGLGLVAADPVAVERLFGRLLSGTLAVAQRGERIVVDLHHDPLSRDRMILAVSRPVMITGRDEQSLLDPGYNPDGDWPEAPVLGLGFALRLVRNIATGCGGALDIQASKLVLSLPLHKIAARTVGN